MKLEDLQEIISLMEHSGIAELSLEEENLKLSLKRETASPVVLPQPAPYAASPYTPTVPPPVAAVPPPADNANIVLIKAPMVGTFYAAPSPDSSPYVSEGSLLAEDTVVCILEAMKVMNEVRAECSGTILEVLVKNGSPVEYGQPLFKVQTR